VLKGLNVFSCLWKICIASDDRLGTCLLSEFNLYYFSWKSVSLWGVIFFVDINVHLNVKIWQGDVQSEPLLKRHRK